MASQPLVRHDIIRATNENSKFRQSTSQSFAHGHGHSDAVSLTEAEMLVAENNKRNHRAMRAKGAATAKTFVAQELATLHIPRRSASRQKRHTWLYESCILMLAAISY